MIVVVPLILDDVDDSSVVDVVDVSLFVDVNDDP